MKYHCNYKKDCDYSFLTRWRHCKYCDARDMTTTEQLYWIGELLETLVRIGRGF